VSSPQPARTSNGHAWRVSYRIAAVERQLALYEEHHHRGLEPLTPEAKKTSQTVVAQIARIPHHPVCRIKCTCPGLDREVVRAFSYWGHLFTIWRCSHARLRRLGREGNCRPAWSRKFWRSQRKEARCTVVVHQHPTEPSHGRATAYRNEAAKDRGNSLESPRSRHVPKDGGTSPAVRVGTCGGPVRGRASLDAA